MFAGRPFYLSGRSEFELNYDEDEVIIYTEYNLFVVGALLRLVFFLPENESPIAPAEIVDFDVRY